jgi:hypothetical protein
MEARVRAQQRTLSELNIDELQALWQEAKRAERE